MFRLRERWSSRGIADKSRRGGMNMEHISEADEDRLIEAQNERDKNVQSRVTTLAWAVSLVTYLALTLIWPILNNAGTPPTWATKPPAGPFLYELRVGFGNALVTFFAFTAFYDVLKRLGSESLERGLISAISGSARLIGLLGTRAKEQHLKHTLSGLLGREFGTALFNDMIDPIITSGGGFRSKYQYDVTILEVSEYPDVASFPSFSLLIDPTKYHWVHEQIEYQAHTTQGEVYWGPFTIALAFDKDTLQELYIDPSAYFRSLIELDAASRAAFFALSDTEIERFLREVMKLRISETVNRHPVSFSVLIDRSRAVSPVITISTIELTTKSGSNKLRVDFIYPHQRDATHFTYSMPQPCKDPRMKFQCSSRIKDLEIIDYFSKIPQGRRRVDPLGTDANPIGYKVEIEGWVFPMSGVIFTWRNQ